MRILTVAVLAASLLAAPGSLAAAVPPAFEGTCQLHGTVTFQPALTVLPRPDVQRATFTGRCSGTIGSTRLTDAPAGETAVEYAPYNSCAGGTDSGTGTLSAGGVALPFTVRETRVIAAVVVSLSGGSWTATGLAAVDPSAGLTAATGCAGSGVSRVAVDVVLYAH
jgi:hypothetical protein